MRLFILELPSMTVDIISRNGGKVTVKLEIDLSGSMLDVEDSIQKAANSVGALATKEKLEQYDTDGSPIKLGSEKLTARTRDNKVYQTPYGKVSVKRYVYQTSRGGAIYCPLEVSARILNTATPRFCKILSNKYARMSAGEASEDMEDNHGRTVARSFIQNTAELIGSIAIAKEEKWSYEIPAQKTRVKTVNISLDGANIHVRKDGYRESMAGAISLYDKQGERLHSIYVAAAPEYGKRIFYKKMEDEITKIKLLYPQAEYVGVADGAKDNWTFLKTHTDKQILDFYHASEYLGGACSGMFYKKKEMGKKDEWLDLQCHNLKHKTGSVARIINMMESHLKENAPPKSHKDKIKAAITYFKNNKHRMKYAEHVANNLPIGSGVTEAACKTIIKARLCGSGMQWKSMGVKIVLSLRPLIKTKGRWQQFWDKISQYGIPVLA